MSTEAKGKCPVDGRHDRPVYITMNNKRTLAIADGEGNCYRSTGMYSTEFIPTNLIDPEDYEFERGLSGMDF